MFIKHPQKRRNTNAVYNSITGNGDTLLTTLKNVQSL